jgi:hypothetical protein
MMALEKTEVEKAYSAVLEKLKRLKGNQDAMVLSWVETRINDIKKGKCESDSIGDAYQIFLAYKPKEVVYSKEVNDFLWQLSDYNLFGNEIIEDVENMLAEIKRKVNLNGSRVK